MVPVFYRVFCTALAGLWLMTSSLQAQTTISSSINLEDSTQVHLIQTQRGDRLIGRIVQLTVSQVDFILQSTQELVVYPLKELTFVGLVDESARSQRRSTSQAIITGEDLFYTSTGFHPELKGLYRNTSLMVNTVDFRVGKYMSLGGGVILPLIANFRAKLTFPVQPFLRLGVAATSYVLFDGFSDGSVLHTYGIATLGDRNRYINIGLGYIFDGDENARYPSFSIGGSYTFNPRNRIYFELGYFHDRFDSFIMPGLQYSFLRGRNKFETGIISVPTDSFIPIPVISYYRMF